jgi:lysophospholipase L1-like esterase
MMKLRWFDVAAIALAVAVIAGFATVFGFSDGTAHEQAPSDVLADRSPVAADERPSALFIGDSYTEGAGTREMSYACMAATRMGWLCDLAARGGTGYISGGPANRSTDVYLGPTTSFSERIAHLAVQYDPDIVVLDGGRNDHFPPREDVFKAMRKTIDDARRAWPDAQIVFVRPRFLARPGDDLGFDDEFMAQLESDPAAAGVLFVDPIASFIGTDTSALLAADGVHPNPRGEQKIGSAFVDSLMTHGGAAAS